MKKTVLTLALVAASVAAFAQGKVSFGNDSSHYFVIGAALAGDTGGGVSDIAGNTVNGAPGAILASPLPSGHTLIAALYAGNGVAGNNLTLATSYALDASATGWLTTGRMVTHGIALAGITGAQVDSFAVVVTDHVGAIGSAYTGAADSSAFYYGTSGLFTMTPGTSLSYPSIVSAGGTTWAGANLVINAVPDPSTFALAGLGAAALMIFRRRK
jgi:hypothetical protein